jgi:manganese efflux pump family protein
MNLTSILLMSVALAMDAMAVSVSRGLATPKIQIGHVTRVAIFFGGFQAVMPLIGYFIGDGIGPLVNTWAAWISLVILVSLGIKMIYESLKETNESSPPLVDLYGFKVMTGLAVATSIDALAVGVTLPLLNAPLIPSVVSIGLITAALSVVGLLLGRQLGNAIGSKMNMLGGVVLIGIGIKMVLA